MLPAIIENPPAVVVIPDQPRAGQWKTRAEERQVHEDIEGRSAGALCRGEDVRQGVLLRPDVDDLDGIDDPVAAGEDSSARDAHGWEKMSGQTGHKRRAGV